MSALPAITVQRLIGDLREEREFLDELIGLVEGGYLSTFTDGAGDQRFNLTPRGKAYLAGGSAC